MIGQYKIQKKELLMQEKDLFIKLMELEKYLNKETIDKLVAILLLEETVFNEKDLYDELGKLDIFYELAKYNIYNKTIKCIQNLNIINKDHLSISNCRENSFISYSIDETNYFEICDLYFSKKNQFSEKDKKPSIILYGNISEESYNNQRLLNKLSQLNYDNESEINIANQVSNILLKDWNIELETNGYSNKLVKKLSWIDIYKKQK